MTRKENHQCQAFNDSCFRLLASLPDGPWRVFCDTTNQRGPVCGVYTWHLVRGEWGELFSHQRGLGSDEFTGLKERPPSAALGFREPLDQMEMPAGTLKQTQGRPVDG